MKINIVEIVSGWKNYISKNPEVEKIAEERMNICIYCPQLNKETNRCKICGCFMVAKTRSLKSKCPAKKW